MAYSLYKVVSIEDSQYGKIVTAVPVSPIAGGDFEVNSLNKFTFVKASKIEVESPSMIFQASFNYKDKF